jgi:catechol 2,3-dioxygenase-like lactoylglutathione lyase family enzyme
MLESSNIITFVATRDPARAKEFYGEILGLSLVADEPTALVYDANGTMLRITKLEEFSTAQYTVLGWIVSDIRRAVMELGHKGITFERYDGFPQDDLRIATFPDGTQVAWFTDPDGNTLSLTQFD